MCPCSVPSLRITCSNRAMHIFATICSPPSYDSPFRLPVQRKMKRNLTIFSSVHNILRSLHAKLYKDGCGARYMLLDMKLERGCKAPKGVAHATRDRMAARNAAGLSGSETLHGMYEWHDEVAFYEVSSGASVIEWSSESVSHVHEDVLFFFSFFRDMSLLFPYPRDTFNPQPMLNNEIPVEKIEGKQHNLN